MSTRAHSSRGYRARPAPRRGRRNGSRIRWDRLGRVALVIVLTAVLASYAGPLVNVVDAWRDSRAEREQLTDLKQRNSELRRKAAATDTPAAAEGAARELGMVAPGERSYVVK